MWPPKTPSGATLLLRTILATALGAAALLAPGAAAAMSGECLWNSLTEARRAEFIEEFRREGLAGDEALRPDELDGFQACGVGESGYAQASLTMAAYLLTLASATVLAERHGLSEGDLEARWRDLARADAEAIGAAMVGVLGGGGGDMRAGDAALGRFVASFGAAPAAEETLAAYAMGRSMLEIMERLPDPLPEGQTAT